LDGCHGAPYTDSPRVRRPPVLYAHVVSPLIRGTGAARGLLRARWVAARARVGQTFCELTRATHSRMPTRRAGGPRHRCSRPRTSGASGRAPVGRIRIARRKRHRNNARVAPGLGTSRPDSYPARVGPDQSKPGSSPAIQGTLQRRPARTGGRTVLRRTPRPTRSRCACTWSNR